MSKWIKIGLLVLLGIVLIVLIIYFIFLRPSGDIPQENVNITANLNVPLISIPVELTNGTSIINSQIVTYNEMSPLDELERKLSNKSRYIAERFGSYSNDSDYENFQDLEIFMTEKMKEWARRYIEELRKSFGNDNFYGVSTKSLKVTTKSLEEQLGVAEFKVSTQRQESREGLDEDRVYYQDIEIKLIKSGEEWMVDGAYWQ